MRNTPRLLPYELTDILELIRQISNVDSGMLRQDPPMYVLTNTEKSFGASAILFPAILQAVRARLQSDYYVLPSSIHECIIIPSDEQLDPEALHEMVKEINEEHVAPEELLGDSVYQVTVRKGSGWRLSFRRDNFISKSHKIDRKQLYFQKNCASIYQYLVSTCSSG